MNSYLEGSDSARAFSFRCEPGQTMVPPPCGATSLRNVIAAIRKARGNVLWPSALIAWSICGAGHSHGPGDGSTFMTYASLGAGNREGFSPPSWAAAWRIESG